MKKKKKRKKESNTCNNSECAETFPDLCQIHTSWYRDHKIVPFLDSLEVCPDNCPGYLATFQIIVLRRLTIFVCVAVVAGCPMTTPSCCPHLLPFVSSCVELIRG